MATADPTNRSEAIRVLVNPMTSFGVGASPLTVESARSYPLNINRGRLEALHGTALLSWKAKALRKFSC
jgi:hypothetical protein